MQRIHVFLHPEYENFFETRMKKIIFTLLLIPFLYGCPYPCDGKSEEVGPLSAEVLTLCPYQNGDKIKLVHNNGKVIQFEVNRSLSKDVFYGISECGSVLNFEKCEIRLTPDYPIFNVSIDIINASRPINEFIISIGRDYFKFMYSDLNGFVDQEIIDSLLIDNNTYYNVFKLPNLNNYGITKNLVDSLYYNVEKGIIKITLSNGESYTYSE